MKHVLVIAYLFPPLGGGGVQRTTKFVKYLARNGWKVTVLSVKPSRFYVVDEQLFHDIPQNVKVIRTAFYSVNFLLAIFRKLKLRFLATFLTKFLIPDPEIGWLLPAARAAKALCQSERFDVLYTTSSPYTAHLVGLTLQKKFPHLKWIADFRDPWTQNKLAYETLGKIRQRLDTMLEKKILRTAHQIISVTKMCSDNLISEFNLAPAKVNTIYNGFDEEDFEKILSKRSIQPKATNIFEIVYCGSAYGDYSPARFIDTMLKQVIQFTPELRMTFVGNSCRFVKSFLKKSGYSDHFSNFFQLRGYVSHSESIEAMMQANLLLLVIPNRIPYNMTGKIFEYMRIGAPILAAVPVNGEAARIIRNVRAGFVVDPENTDEIAEIVLQAYSKWKVGALTVEPDQTKIAHFRRDMLTLQLTKVFNKALETV